MKKLFFISVLFSLLFYSCDEGCDATIAEEKSGFINSTVLVLDQNGNDVRNYPVWVDFQKRWCEGDWALIVTNQGETGSDGYFVTSPNYDLNNEGDYVQVTFRASPNTEDEQIFSEKATYNDFASWGPLLKNHTFFVTQ